MTKVSKITLATVTRHIDQLVLALAILGGMAEIGSFLFDVVLPKVTKASTVVTGAWLSHVTVADSFANKLGQCK